VPRAEEVGTGGAERIIVKLEDLVNRMKGLAASSSRMGGTDPNVAALARSLADLGEMAAAMGERMLGVERRLELLERAATPTGGRPASPGRPPDGGA
jgi:hypothetical protein